MTETIKPDATDPADRGTDDTSKLQPGESFLEPDDADPDETGGPGGSREPSLPRVPPPPD